MFGGDWTGWDIERDDKTLLVEVKQSAARQVWSRERNRQPSSTSGSAQATSPTTAQPGSQSQVGTRTSKKLGASEADHRALVHVVVRQQGCVARCNEGNSM
jgi:hypothetical protein